MKNDVNQLLEELKTYLHQTLNITIEPSGWIHQNNLPFFVTDCYHFFETCIFGRTCLLMIDRDRQDIAPGVIQKHIMQVDVKTDSIVIYVQSTICSYNRKRLIEMNVPFIIPGNQMFLPHFVDDLMGNFKKMRKKKKKGL